MPTIHASQSVVDKIDEKLVQLITEGQCKIKRSTVLELALIHGVDKVTVAQALLHEALPVNSGGMFGGMSPKGQRGEYGERL